MTERDRVLQLVPELTSPYIQAIWEVPFPEQFRPPNIQYYDGSTDPLEHIERYSAEMMTNRTTEVVMCRAFPRTLSGVAFEWLSSLPAGTISNFKQLTNLFLTRFANKQKLKKDPLTLFGFMQRPAESLRSYIERFKEEITGMAGLDSYMDFGTVIRGLREGPFKEVSP
ncbi:hypothetical protein J5N97_022645 [Dioscorea zingiberensis]|uniref:Retrotransposon gag domain-containing protein n=1 Tax=Dioscorea zingiberensis TaxID=325984 RepID=A0A9D5HB68_9LILI|nr:hypothetical protein J5N97_022645 [Dioscorea zingiberensis]